LNKFAKDKDPLTAASFEAQRIRTYQIEYSLVKTETKKAEESKPVVTKAPV